MKALYYFGTEIGCIGHYVHQLKSNYIEEVNIKLPFDPENYPKNPIRNGHSEFHVFEGWSIFAITGSCSDRRGGSKTVFFINEVVSIDDLISLIKESRYAMRIINSLPFDVELIPRKVKK